MSGAVAVGFYTKDAWWILIGVTVVLLYWIAFYHIEKGSVTSSILPSSLVSCLLLLGINEARLRVIVNGGSRTPDRIESPLAFGLGVAFELFWCLYFFATAMLGLLIVVQPKRRGTVPTENQTASTGIAVTASDSGNTC